MTQSGTIANDERCGVCGAQPEYRTCSACGQSARITDCDHQSQPRPIAAGRNDGSAIDRAFCSFCALDTTPLPVTITISSQHLDGDDPEGFDVDAWLEALEATYREVVQSQYPHAEIVVNIDRQRACGASQPLSIDVEGEGAGAIDRASLECVLNHTQQALYERGADRFWA